MKSHLSNEEVKSFKYDLETRRNQIVESLQRTSREVTSCQSKGRSNESDQASFFQGANIYKTITDKQALMLKDIELSLVKIEESTYGICEMCEEPIPIERLKVKIFARYCIHCREIVEKEEASRTK